MSSHTIDRTVRGGKQTVRPAGWTAAPDVRRILNLSVPVSVVLAERNLTIESVLQFTVGSIVEFDVPFDAELVLQAADRPIGAGLAVKVGENFGLRLSRIGTIRERIDALAGRRGE